MVGVGVASRKSAERIAQRLQYFIEDVPAADVPPGPNLLIELYRDRPASPPSSSRFLENKIVSFFFGSARQN
jgi:hypothetical protein